MTSSSVGRLHSENHKDIVRSGCWKNPGGIKNPKGVDYRKDRKKWRARYKGKFLGYFDYEKDAKEAFLIAAEQ